MSAVVEVPPASDPEGRPGAAATLRALAARLRPDPPRAIFAFNVALISMLTVYVSFRLGVERVYWGLLTVPFIAQMNIGNTVWRSVTRLVGTLLGAAYGFVLVNLFSQEPVAAIGATAAWLFAMAVFARFELGLDSYSYASSGVAAITVVLNVGPDLHLAYDITLARTTDTVVPIVVAFCVLFVVLPSSARGQLRAQVAGARSRVIRLVDEAVRPGDTAPVAERQAATRAVAALFDTLRSLRLERSLNVPDSRKATALTYRLSRLLAQSESVAFVFDVHRDHDPSPELAALLDEFHAQVARVERDPSDAVNRSASAAEEAAAFAGLEARAGAMLSPSRAPAFEGDARTMLDGVRRLAGSFRDFLETEAALHDPEAPQPALPRVVLRYRDWRAALQHGVKPALVFTALAILWIGTASSGVRTLAQVAGIITLSLSALAPRKAQVNGAKSLGLGMLAVLPCVLLLEAVLPLFDTFWEFTLLLGTVIYVFTYLCGAGPTITFVYGGFVLLAVGLQPSNAEVYEPLILLNATPELMFLPVILVAASTIVFPENQRWLERHLARGFTELARRTSRRRGRLGEDAFLAQCVDLLNDYGGDLDPDDAGTAPLVERCRTLQSVGLILHELRSLERDSGPSTATDGVADEVSDAVRAASRGGDPVALLETLDAVTERARRRPATASTSGSGPRGAEPEGVDELVLALAHLRTIVASRSLAAPEAAVHAT